MRDLLTDAPCVFCGYNGAGYFQEGTHDPKCPWFTVGGFHERQEAAPSVLARLAAENAALKSKVEHYETCASAPLMRTVMEQRDSLAAEIERLTSALNKSRADAAHLENTVCLDSGSVVVYGGTEVRPVDTVKIGALLDERKRLREVVKAADAYFLANDALEGCIESQERRKGYDAARARLEESNG